MARLARVVAIDIAHHVTQRGNARRSILDNDIDCAIYLDLLRENIERQEVLLLGYCLMSNHVHLIATPGTTDGLALALKHTHGRYATYWNTAHRSSGHAWQGRYYSCPLDQSHLWQALRYTELNPVRAGLVPKAELWKWSSAPSHCCEHASDALLAMAAWQAQWSSQTWREYLTVVEKESDLTAIRRCTYTGRPLGSTEFIASIEKQTRRKLALQKGGRPKKSIPEPEQRQLDFAG